MGYNENKCVFVLIRGCIEKRIQSLLFIILKFIRQIIKMI